jgi:hypothetical protein
MTGSALERSGGDGQGRARSERCVGSARVKICRRLLSCFMKSLLLLVSTSKMPKF